MAKSIAVLDQELLSAQSALKMLPEEDRSPATIKKLEKAIENAHGKLLAAKKKEADKAAKAKAENEKADALALSANSAFVIATELETIVNSIVEAEGECSDETFMELKSWNAALEIKAHNICLVKSRLEHEAEYFKAVEMAAAARRKSRENAVARLKKYLAQAMSISGKKSIKANDGLFSVTLIAGKAKTIITDENRLPFDMTEIVELVKPKAKEIKEALEGGKEIPGAELEYGSDYVMIKGG